MALTVKSCMALERAGKTVGLDTLSNTRAFATRILRFPPMVDQPHGGPVMHPRAIAVGRGWIIATDYEFAALSGVAADESTVTKKRGSPLSDAERQARHREASRRYAAKKRAELKS